MDWLNLRDLPDYSFGGAHLRIADVIRLSHLV